MAHTRGLQRDRAKAIDNEIRRIIDECHEKARTILNENMDILHKCADLLIEKEKITGEEFTAFVEN